MRRNSKKLTGNIATVKNKYLKISKSPEDVHMVYIRKDNGNTVDVNIITSLEDYNKYNESIFRKSAIKKIKDGYYYSLPFNKKIFNKWSAVNLYKVENIQKNKIKLKKNRRISNKDKMVISILGNKKRT